MTGKTLHLIRHAKSSWDDPSLSDKQRPLAPRGIKACKLMAKPILKAGIELEHIYCSSALRAQQTIAGLSEHFDRDCQWHTDDALYTFDGDLLLRWLSRLDDERDEVTVIGHNPALEDFCNAKGDLYLEKLPTCAYVKMTFPIAHWSELGHCRGFIHTLLTPKIIKRAKKASS